MIRSEIEKAVAKALGELGAPDMPFTVEHPPAGTAADYATNAALVAAKALKRPPREVAQELVERLRDIPHIERVEAAGPGFVNFILDRKFFADVLREITAQGREWGGNSHLRGQRIIIEYTDPNPFKEFHIGHLMSNAIGESLSRILERSGAEVKRANYQGDVGLHVAKALWAMLRTLPPEQASGTELVSYLGKMYAQGAAAYEEDEAAKQEIHALNKKVYERSDAKVNGLYDLGRKLSLERFEELYTVLGTRFDFYFFENEAGPRGRDLVLAHLDDGIFERSDGAVVFRGEAHGLHTRVFLNSEGLPTYEAKELALPQMKQEKYPYTLSIVVTANEIRDYFRVILLALGRIYPELAEKTRHVTHGFMRLASGKMSSRKGNVVTGESLITDVTSAVEEKMRARGLDSSEIASQIAVAGIKFAILRQDAGKDISFDPERSLSLEGDSGPYLQYAHVRACSILRKAKEESALISFEDPSAAISEPEKLLPRFPEIVERAATQYEPHHIAQYLIELAGAFNSWYASERVLGTPDAPYKLAVVDAVRQTLQNGLWLLGCHAPEEM